MKNIQHIFHVDTYIFTEDYFDFEDNRMKFECFGEEFHKGAKYKVFKNLKFHI